MEERPEFGSYLRAKRLEAGISLRELALRLGFSAPYWCDIEYGHRNPPPLEKLELAAELLGMTAEERDIMFDLAGAARDGVAPDLQPYMRDRAYVGLALRRARDLGAGEDDWERFVRELEQRAQKGQP